VTAEPGSDELLAALRRVLDPCSLKLRAPVDIWELGLVDDVRVRGGDVTVRLVLTDVSCVFYRGIRQHVIDVVSEVPGVETVTVELATDVIWTPDRMRRDSGALPASPEARELSLPTPRH
jgi:metal-sulfur cluster biosynthetic enzyme